MSHSLFFPLFSPLHSMFSHVQLSPNSRAHVVIITNSFFLQYSIYDHQSSQASRCDSKLFFNTLKWTPNGDRDPRSPTLTDWFYCIAHFHDCGIADWRSASVSLLFGISLLTIWSINIPFPFPLCCSDILLFSITKLIMFAVCFCTRNSISLPVSIALNK